MVRRPVPGGRACRPPVFGRAGRARPAPAWPPRRTATAGSGRPAGTGSIAAGRASRRSPGRRPPRTARCPSVAIAGTATTSSPGPEHPTKRVASADERLRQQRPTVEMEEVEREERDRPPGLARPAGAPAPPGRHAPLHRRRPARRRGSPSGPRPGRPARRAPGGRPSGRRPSRVDDPDVAGARQVRRPDHRQRALAAPPRLEQVLVRIERLRQRSRQHRPQVRELGQLVGLEAQRELVGHRGIDGSPLDCSASRVPRSLPCHVRPAPTTCTGCASRPNRACRRTAASPSSRCRPSRAASTATARRSGSCATDGEAPPRQLTLGARHDRHARFSPDGRTLAFLSDRRTLVEEEPDRAARADDGRDREDATQVHLLPLDGGEARRLTDLPRGVDAFEWSPDGTRLVVTSTSRGATADRGRPSPGHERGRAGAGIAAGVRLSVHRPARLHVQRQGLHLRPGRPPLARRRRDRSREPPDRRAGLPTSSRPGRRTARRIAFVSNRRTRRRSRRAAGHPRRRRRDAGRHRDHPGTALGLRRAGLAARRADDRGARPSPGGTRGAVATTSGCSPPTAPTRGRRRSEPVGAARPDAARRRSPAT